MKSDKQIAFIQLIFQHFLEKFLTIICGMSEFAFCLCIIFYPWPNL